MFTIIQTIFWAADGLMISAEALMFAGVFAFILTWLRQNSGSIVAPVVLHSIVNTVWRSV